MVFTNQDLNTRYISAIKKEAVQVTAINNFIKTTQFILIFTILSPFIYITITNLQFIQYLAY